MLITHLARACYPFHPYGGLERHVYHLTLELARLGHEVWLYTQPPDFAQAQVDDPAWQAQVQHRCVPYSTVSLLRRNSIPDRLVNYPLFAWKLGRAVRTQQPAPQIVHAHGLAGYGYAWRGLPGVPLVLNPHGMEEFNGRSRAKQLAYAPFRRLLRQTARQSAALIATDVALIPQVQQNLDVPESKVALISNAVALDELDTVASLDSIKTTAAKFGLHNQGKFLFLSVGRVEANKGFEVGLQALASIGAELGQKQASWRWVVVGEGSVRARLEQETARLGLTERVTWAGAVDGPTLHSLYELADLFVHPTLYEGSSLVTLEALAHRRPVLASATGGLPDKVLESGSFENGRLVPPDNTAALAAKLLEMASFSSEKRRQLGENGRKLVESSFSWPAAARQTVALYESLREGTASG